MSIDYIRVYQRKDSINIGCDPKKFPTSSYIETSVLIFEIINLRLNHFAATRLHIRIPTCPHGNKRDNPGPKTAYKMAVIVEIGSFEPSFPTSLFCTFNFKLLVHID